MISIYYKQHSMVQLMPVCGVERQQLTRVEGCRWHDTVALAEPQDR